MTVVLWGMIVLLWMGLMLSPLMVAGVIMGEACVGGRKNIGDRMFRVAFFGILVFLTLAIVWGALGLAAMGVAKLL